MFKAINSLVELNYYDEYEDSSDEELVEAVKNGDVNAEEYLFVKYFYLIKVVISSFFIMGGDKEDLFQEAMIGLYKAIKDFDYSKKSSFRTFAELCIKRQIITAVRQASRQKHNPLNNYLSINTKPIESSDKLAFLEKYKSVNIIDPEKLVVGKEQANIINSLIENILSDFEHKVLNYYMQGESYSEISNIMHRDTKAIDNALQRVKKKMLRYIKI